jgi:hypothetical protein
MSALRFSPLLLAAVTGCTVSDYDRPSRADGVPSVAVADVAAGMIDDLSPNHFFARIGEMPLGGHGAAGGHEGDVQDAAIGVEPEIGTVHGTARLDATQDGRLIFLDAEGFALRIEVMMPETAFASRTPEGGTDVPPAAAPVAGEMAVDLQEAGDGTAQETADAAAALVDEGEADALLDDDAGLTVLQTYAGEPRLRASLIVDGVRMDSQSGEVHLRTIRDDRLRGWFYFDVERLVTDGLDNETERVYGAFDAVMMPVTERTVRAVAPAP